MNIAVTSPILLRHSPHFGGKYQWVHVFHREIVEMSFVPTYQTIAKVGLIRKHFKCKPKPTSMTFKHLIDSIISAGILISFLNHNQPTALFVVVVLVDDENNYRLTGQDYKDTTRSKSEPYMHINKEISGLGLE